MTTINFENHNGLRTPHPAEPLPDRCIPYAEYYVEHPLPAPVVLFAPMADVITPPKAGSVRIVTQGMNEWSEE